MNTIRKDKEWKGQLSRFVDPLKKLPTNASYMKVSVP